MPAPLSVVIPTLNAENELTACAATLMEGVQAGLVRDLVVSDGGSTDATIAVARGLGATVVTGPRGRGGQMARGVAAARGDWLMLLHADSRLAPGWAEAAGAHMARDPARAAYLRLSFRASGAAPALVAAWARARARVFGLPYGDQGLLIRREVLVSVGGVPELALMEDVALARALRGRLVALDAGISTGAQRYQAAGWLRQGAGNLVTLGRYLAGADPAVLARRYDRD